MPDADLEEQNYRDLLAAAQAEWGSGVGISPERCRRAMLACFGLQDYSLGYVWRARALRLAVESQDRNVLAALYVQEAVRVATAEMISGRQEDPVQRPSAAYLAAASAILEECAAILAGGVDEERAPSPATLSGLLHEKRGLIRLYDGRFREAEDDYQAAVAHAERVQDARRVLKASAGLALVRYLGAASTAQREDQCQATDVLARRAVDGGFHDVARMAAQNLRLMREGSPDVQPYELL